jgi:myo-inositol 2-dehydrogenase/D-chiro-inositol 1-dehydrogenase
MQVPLAPSGEVFELVEEIRLTAEAIRQRKPLVSPREARARVLLCLAAERSAAEGRPIELQFEFPSNAPE